MSVPEEKSVPGEKSTGNVQGGGNENNLGDVSRGRPGSHGRFNRGRGNFSGRNNYAYRGGLGHHGGFDNMNRGRGGFRGRFNYMNRGKRGYRGSFSNVNRRRDDFHETGISTLKGRGGHYEVFDSDYEWRPRVIFPKVDDFYRNIVKKNDRYELIKHLFENFPRLESSLDVSKFFGDMTFPQAVKLVESIQEKQERNSQKFSVDVLPKWNEAVKRFPPPSLGDTLTAVKINLLQGFDARALKNIKHERFPKALISKELILKDIVQSLIKGEINCHSEHLWLCTSRVGRLLAGVQHAEKWQELHNEAFTFLLENPEMCPEKHSSSFV